MRGAASAAPRVHLEVRILTERTHRDELLAVWERQSIFGAAILAGTP